jgi:hypothetical protein
MRKRPTKKTRPDLEQLEPKRPLSAGASTSPLADLKAGARSHAARHIAESKQAAATGDTAITAQETNVAQSVSASAVKPNFGFLVYRRTNPNPFNDTLTPPFAGHVLVQSRQPIPGQVYNVLSVIVRNGTLQTFDASSGFTVMFPGQSQRTPILTDNEQWKPGQEFVFYVLTKKYYPINNQVSGGFRFFLGGAESTAIPGPSGMFLRLTYNQATINRTLDAIIAYGQGAEGGAGIKTGLADTAIYEFLSAKTRRSDFGGYF